MPRKLPRRDFLHAVASRASTLSTSQSAIAWAHLSNYLADLSLHPSPKYKHLIHAIRQATILAKNPTPPKNSPKSKPEFQAWVNSFPKSDLIPKPR